VQRAKGLESSTLVTLSPAVVGVSPGALGMISVVNTPPSQAISVAR
jgi:hypothetical protein